MRVTPASIAQWYDRPAQEGTDGRHLDRPHNEEGADDRVVVSHDSVRCWRGAPFPDPELWKKLTVTNHLLHFSQVIAPQLIEAGATEAQVDALMIDNPRRFFAGDKLPALSG